LLLGNIEQFEKSSIHPARAYDIRALGRRGVLSLNAVAPMSQSQAIET
jgi:hypothetical protein